MTFFSVQFIKAGINPTTDVSWRVYPPPQYGAALDKGEVQAIAAFDPFPFLLTQSGKAVEIGTNMMGMYANNFCWQPSATALKPQIVQGARDFKLTGFLDKRTDPQELAERAYIDIFKLAGESSQIGHGARG